MKTCEELFDNLCDDCQMNGVTPEEFSKEVYILFKATAETQCKNHKTRYFKIDFEDGSYIEYDEKERVDL